MDFIAFILAWIMFFGAPVSGQVDGDLATGTLICSTVGGTYCDGKSMGTATLISCLSLSVAEFHSCNALLVNVLPDDFKQSALYIFIKYNNASIDEARTQLFFYEQIMKKRDSVIRIPEIYHAFETELGLTYILMEHIDIKDKASDEQIAQAVSELISIPPPAGVFGSISGGRIRHFFFRDREAPFHFSSAFELADFINGTLSCVRKVQREPDNDKVDFSNEPLMCYYSDLHRDNFPVDSNGQLWVVDFQQAGVLPSSFMTFALHSSRQRRLPLPIRKTIPLPETSNLKLISYVSYILQISWNMYTPGESIS